MDDIDCQEPDGRRGWLFHGKCYLIHDRDPLYTHEFHRLIIPKQTTAATTGTVRKRERLGGMLNYYFREAA